MIDRVPGVTAALLLSAVVSHAQTVHDAGAAAAGRSGRDPHLQG